jgi:glycine hydroxymethyltransferase
MADIARRVDALFLVDMAHVAGLVAAGVYDSPLAHADYVTCTTTKTLRGPRGGLILARDEANGKRLQAAIFPGVQGSLHSNVLAAKAVCLGEALRPEFRQYGAQVVTNAKVLSRILLQRGIRLVGGGTDSHMLLLDLSPQGILGRDAEQALAAANITSNKNPIPFDQGRPADWSGLRLGVAAATTRGFDEVAMTQLGECIADLIVAAGEGRLAAVTDHAGSVVAALCDRFPIAQS